ncbi:outer membrane protein assembly factor BamD [Fodinibius salsisoli]|uniref:Outer membrane protein assembly factor BamD n=1 Tax=Fodinibius salsisoli TaxID=2820877 RepID=A0ABT3PMC1_9BACT|nr:outer membrane protein assembly factor BamD [Fodinibius salsisoli]MCW9706314.1 outer membrane protein assembly factor BamD [Fodinibius salsisoli]
MNNISTYLFRFSCLLLMLMVIGACKNDNLIQRGDTLPTAYKKAMALYQSDDYTDAAKAFETVIQLGRGTDYAREAQYYLAESYFNDKRYLLSSSEYGRFVTLYPRADKREEAQFKEAYSYYKLSPRYRLDQAHTRTAIEKFQLFSSRYPNSERSDQASKYITELRSKLAKKLYYSADLYKRTDSYEAAIVYYDLTIDNYPESIWAQRALVNEIDTYVTYANRSVTSKQRERYQAAIEAYEKFIQLFPEGEYRQEAEEYVDEAREGIADLGSSETSQDTNGVASSSGSNSE